MTDNLNSKLSSYDINLSPDKLGVAFLGFISKTDYSTMNNVTNKHVGFKEKEMLNKLSESSSPEYLENLLNRGYKVLNTDFRNEDVEIRSPNQLDEGISTYSKAYKLATSKSPEDLGLAVIAGVESYEDFQRARGKAGKEPKVHRELAQRIYQSILVKLVQS